MVPLIILLYFGCTMATSEIKIVVATIGDKYTRFDCYIDRNILFDGITWNKTMYNGKTYTYTSRLDSRERNTYSRNQNLRYGFVTGNVGNDPYFVIYDIEMIDAGFYSCIINGTILNTVNFVVVKQSPNFETLDQNSVSHSFSKRYFDELYSSGINTDFESVLSYNTFDVTRCHIYTNVPSNITFLNPEITVITEIEKIVFYRCIINPAVTLVCVTNVSANHEITKIISWEDVYNLTYILPTPPKIKYEDKIISNCVFDKKTSEIFVLIYGVFMNIALLTTGIILCHYLYRIDKNRNKLLINNKLRVE
jgi:hypothetical protein